MPGKTEQWIEGWMEKWTEGQTDPNLYEPSDHGWESNKTFAYICLGDSIITSVSVFYFDFECMIKQVQLQWTTFKCQRYKGCQSNQILLHYSQHAKNLLNT